MSTEAGQPRLSKQDLSKLVSSKIFDILLWIGVSGLMLEQWFLKSIKCIIMLNFNIPVTEARDRLSDCISHG